MDNFIVIWFTVAILLGFYSLWKFLDDNKNSFKEYLIPELEKEGLKFVSSANYRSTPFDSPFDIPGEDISANPVGARYSSFRISLYPVYREVVFRDNLSTGQKVDSGSEMPEILPISGISARNDSVPVFGYPKIFVLYTAG